MTCVAFIIHGKIWQKEKIVADIKKAFGEGYQLEFYVTLYKDHIMELAYEAVRKGTTHIIAVGGDGSLNGLVNGIIWAKKEGIIPEADWNRLRIGVLAKGTGNDFARTMGLTYSPQQLKDCIDRDNYCTTDIGMVEYHTRDRVEITRYFINVADVGVGGFVARQLANSSKIFGATVTYQLQIIQSLLTYKDQPVKVTVGDQTYEGRVKELLVANGRYFGGGLCAGPDVRVDDGLFSIVIAGQISLFTYLLNIGNMKNCRKINHPEVRYLSSNEIFIDSPYPLPLDMDGELAGYTPLRMSLIPHMLKFISPLKKQNPLLAERVSV